MSKQANNKSANGIKGRVASVNASIKDAQAYKASLSVPESDELLEAMRVACLEGADRYLGSLNQTKGQIVSKIGRR